tara:strand:- start:160 stop:696 length:537 start_codon:yes stop_codon:yes gene_type:complete
MDPVTIALAIAGTKKLLQTANDLKSISGSLENLFNAHEAKPKKIKHKLPKTRMQQILRIKSGDSDYDDDTSISAVANDILEAKKNERALENLATEIDVRFGRGTFEAIKIERAKRIEAKKVQTAKNKERAAAQKEIDDKYWDNVFAIIKNIFILIVVSIICVVIGWLMVNFGCKEAVC